MDSILGEKLQLVMRRINSFILLSLFLFVFLPSKGFSQCPEKVVMDNQVAGNSDFQVLLVLDSFDADVDISSFEVNVFNEDEGKYLIIESTNFPSIGINNDIQINKEGNRILLANIPDNVDLLRCIVILIGNECPIQKITISF